MTIEEVVKLYQKITNRLENIKKFRKRLIDRNFYQPIPGGSWSLTQEDMNEIADYLNELEERLENDLKQPFE